MPKDLQGLIWRMAQANPTWGQERIANELLLKLGLQVSPRTVRKYMPAPRDGNRHRGLSSQRWATFIRNHAKGIIACDFVWLSLPPSASSTYLSLLNMRDADSCTSMSWRILLLNGCRFYSRRSDIGCQSNFMWCHVQSSAACIMHTSWLNRQREEADKRREAIDNAIVSLEVGNMAAERVVIPGIVKNGVVVPQNDIPLPDGARVDILISPTDVTPELEAELDQWDKASDEAWAMIDRWEAEER